ncbi:MAG: glycosyl hydrolase family 18 protein [Bacteroidia bacterium]|nr:glycosyl hydrolase family 18 protein [Bacteroidia bacterium]
MIRTRTLVLLLLSLISGNLLSQETDTLRMGIHQEESEYYSAIFPKDQPSDEKGKAFPAELDMAPEKNLTAKILGWHPYWAASTAYLNYDYNALSHIAFFSYEVDTATGGYTTIRGWNTTPIIDYAHQNGTKVLLTVTNFGTAKNTELLSDPIKQMNLVNTLIPLLKSRNADGVNFDLESVSLSQRSNLVNFMQMAVNMIKAELPNAEISMATPAVDWSGSWDLKNLSEICDYLIVMGYDYYWSGSTTAGPVAPLAGENYNISRTINTYLNAGVPNNKLLLGVPWYGYDWPVTSTARKSSATGKATARIYTSAQDYANQYSETFDELTQSAWVSYMSSTTWRQLWFDDDRSLRMKYEYAASEGLAGVGIWALSYEGAYDEVWSTITDIFSEKEEEVAENTIIISISPNPVPVYGTSTIKFSLLEKETISLKIYDTNGRERIVLADEEREPGVYTEDFNPAVLNDGVYFCTLRTKNKISSRKIVITK